MQFKTEKISEHITRIHGFCTEFMYLIEGSKAAVLIDTGCGFYSLKNCIHNLTNKPLKVLITHGHVDHAMGANEFEEIYLNHKDKSVYQLHSEKGFRQEGDVFELGGIHVVIYELPGHTLGSVVMLIPEERTILLGDACNPFLFLFDKFSTGLASYEKNLRALQKKIAGKYDRVLISHGNGDSKPTTLEDVLKVCQDIRSGNVTDRNFVFSGETHPLADNGTYTFICYDKKRIEE